MAIPLWFKVQQLLFGDSAYKHYQPMYGPITPPGRALGSETVSPSVPGRPSQYELGHPMLLTGKRTLTIPVITTVHYRNPNNKVIYKAKPTPQLGLNAVYEVDLDNAPSMLGG